MSHMLCILTSYAHVKNATTLSPSPKRSKWNQVANVESGFRESTIMQESNQETRNKKSAGVRKSRMYSNFPLRGVYGKTGVKQWTVAS
jgi:hypothetical protein